MPEQTPEQLSFESMPQRLFACTPNRLATFDCPRRYRFTYLDDPPPQRSTPWARATVGAVAHVALYRWWTLPAAHRTPDEGAALVERNWPAGSLGGFRDAAQSLRSCVRTADWVREYLTGLDPHDEPVGVERTVAVATDTLAISGRVDRIDARGGELVIVDYKTGRHAPEHDDARRSRALALYVLATRRTLRRACRRVELHHLPTGTVASFEHTDATLADHLRDAERTARGIEQAIAADAFEPRPSAACSWCDFRRACPEGRAASEPRVSWAGLPDDAA